MARRRRDDSEAVKVVLTTEEIGRLGHEYAELMRRVEGMEEARKQENSERREAIKRLLLDARKLRDQVISGERDATIFDGEDA
jgi:hypothetical protein